MKIRDVKDAAVTISESFDKRYFGKILSGLAITNNMCIEITDPFCFPLYSYEMMPDNCLIHGNYS